jgi:signal transduction histidine kinase
MTSLRRQLLAWLLPLYVVAAIVAMLATYWGFGRTVDFFMDNQLRVLADSHAGQPLPAASIRSLTAHNVAKGDLIVQIWDRNDRLLATSWPQLALTRQQSTGFQDLAVGADRWRVYTLHSPDRTVQSAQSLTFREHVIKSQALQAGLPIALLIPVSAIILWFAIRLTLRRLEVVAKAAALQDEHHFGDLPIEHVPAEIQPLVLGINTLLARLSEAFAAQRRFVQDAAHELRTPITALSLQLENLKARVTDGETSAQVAQLEAGVTRTKRLVEQLLRLARQETPRNPSPPAHIALDEFLKDIIAEFMPLADRRHIDLGFDTNIEAVVTADIDDLRSLIHNLFDNALRYTPEGGIVDVKLREDAGIVTLQIVDSGTGIPADLLPRVFDRFFRIEGSDTEGSGLGLAIARHAAERNRIELDLRNRTDGPGLIARIRFDTASTTYRNSSTAHAQPEWATRALTAIAPQHNREPAA